jgi:hypothetical protein
MGRILPFPAASLPSCPDAAEALDPAEAICLHAIRWWVADMKAGIDPLLRLRDDMIRAGAPDAALSLDQFMRIITRTAWRQVGVACPHCPRISADEQLLLLVAGMAQAREAGLARDILRTGVLSAGGAEFALGPLEGLGRLFAGAGLAFRRRALPRDAMRIAEAARAWASVPPASVH